MVDSSSPDFPEPQGISLNELTEAYAQAMGGEVVAEPDQQPESGQETVETAEAIKAEAADILPLELGEEAENEAEVGSDGVSVSPLLVLETLLFVGSIENEPLAAAKAAELMRGVTPGNIVELIDELNARYRSNGCPYKIVSEGAGFRMTLHKLFDPIRNRFHGKVREARLSQASVDTLAIVAYRQPLTTEQVTNLRGTPSGHLLTQLVRRQLLAVERVEGSRKARYRTSERFLELFGLDSLEDLPDSE